MLVLNYYLSGKLFSPFPSAVRSDSVRRPIGFRPPSDWIPFAVRSDSVRVTMTFREVLLRTVVFVVIRLLGFSQRISGLIGFTCWEYRSALTDEMAHFLGSVSL